MYRYIGNRGEWDLTEMGHNRCSRGEPMYWPSNGRYTLRRVARSGILNEELIRSNAARLTTPSDR